MSVHRSALKWVAQPGVALSGLKSTARQKVVAELLFKAVRLRPTTVEGQGIFKDQAGSPLEADGLSSVPRGVALVLIG